MNKKYHFISGLPRSGSTLLTSILNQNPRFYSEITNPLVAFIKELIEINSKNSTNRIVCPTPRMKNTINGMIDGYYSEYQDKEVFFNCNRSWTEFTGYLNEINPNFKIICTVREYVSILNSFELLYQRSGFTDAKNIYKTHGTSIYSRTNFLANESFVASAYDALKGAFYGPYSKHLLLVEYFDLVNRPKEMLTKIYDFIEEPYFEHNFEDVGYSFDEYDNALGIRNLHKISPKVQFKQSPTVLPPDLYNAYKGWEFWR
jgi:sulfotransferase